MTDPTAALRAHRATLITYLLSKADAEDWHGVADAANDLREVDAKLELLANLGDGCRWPVQVV